MSPVLGWVLSGGYRSRPGISIQKLATLLKKNGRKCQSFALCSSGRGRTPAPCHPRGILFLLSPHQLSATRPKRLAARDTLWLKSCRLLSIVVPQAVPVTRPQDAARRQPRAQAPVSSRKRRSRGFRCALWPRYTVVPLHVPEWRNWQTRGTQNPVLRKGSVGSIPSSGTIRLGHSLRCGLAHGRPAFARPYLATDRSQMEAGYGQASPPLDTGGA